MLSDGFLVLSLFKQVSLFLLLKGLYLWQLVLVWAPCQEDAWRWPTFLWQHLLLCLLLCLLLYLLPSLYRSNFLYLDRHDCHIVLLQAELNMIYWTCETWICIIIWLLFSCLLPRRFRSSTDSAVGNMVLDGGVALRGENIRPPSRFYLLLLL